MPGEERGVPETQEATRLWSLVEAAIARWRDGEPPDAAAFLERHPEIATRKAMALELIEEELGLRQEAGDTVVPSTFVARFKDYHSSIRKVLEIRPEFEKARIGLEKAEDAIQRAKESTNPFGRLVETGAIAPKAVPTLTRELSESERKYDRQRVRQLATELKTLVEAGKCGK